MWKSKSQQLSHCLLSLRFVEGFTSRFPGLLRSGTVVFKTSRYREWYHGVVKPYVDYIPVNYDTSDLVEKVEWIQQNPEIAERMTQHAREQVERYLRPVDMQCYLYRLLLEYQTLFKEVEQPEFDLSTILSKLDQP